MDLKSYFFNKNIVYRLPRKTSKTKFDEKDVIDFFSKKSNLEALYLASPVLFNSFMKLRENKCNNKNKTKILYSLLKYQLRMHNRSTPFGLFASCGTIQWGDNKTTLNFNLEYKRKTRFDMHYSISLITYIIGDPEIKKFLKYYLNSSLYKVGENYRYVEYVYNEGRRIHYMNSVESDEYIDEVFKYMTNGRRLKEIISFFLEQGFEESEANSFVQELIEKQIIVSELEPSVSGNGVIQDTISTLKKINKRAKSSKINYYVTFLKRLTNKLEKLDKGNENGIQKYSDIESYLKEIDVPVQKSKLFQLDLFSEGENNKLESEIKNTLFDTIEILDKISIKTEGALEDFKIRFQERYEDRKVPLLQALDNEIGIGYANKKQDSGTISPLIDEIIFPDKRTFSNINLNQVEIFLLEKIIKSKRTNPSVLNITKEDVDNFSNSISLPSTLSVMFSVLDENKKIYLKSVGGSSGTNLLGRFSSGSTEIREVVNDIIEHERGLISNDSILAEILHLPENRTGNILLRPSLENYEIAYLSGGKKSKQINVNDLYLHIKDNELILTSKSLKKMIIPRLSNAHNYSYNSLPVYHFLCDYQLLNVKGNLSFGWGSLSQVLDFFPRVQIGEVIVSPMKWIVEKENFKNILNNEKSFTDWREENQLPDIFVLSESDNELIIDSSSDLSSKMFIEEIKNKDKIVLKEYLFNTDNLFCRDENGKGYTNEFIATLMNKQSSRALKEKEDSSSLSSITRNFTIGSEWLYTKLYTGSKTVENLLTDYLSPLAEKLSNDGIIDHWFFIRYSDPHPHLRFRLHIINPEVNTQKVIEILTPLLEKELENNIVWKVQFETYTREIERYGTTTMVLSEKIFNVDSLSIKDFLSIDAIDLDSDLRWLFGIKSIDVFLDGFNFSLHEKLKLLYCLKTSFESEFNSNKFLKSQIDRKYRQHSISIRELIQNGFNDSNINSILKKKSELLYPLIKSVKAIDPLINKNYTFISSHIHMHVNRLIKNKQRKHELLIYDFLWRYYRSELAIEKFKKMEVSENP